MPTKKNKALGNGQISTLPGGLGNGAEFLPADCGMQIYRTMLQARAMEERMIKMSKSGEGFFWIGGPGEEAFNTVLGLQVKKGQGPAYDYLHLHYRNSAVLVAMGMDVIDGIRQMVMAATDPHSFGRNFTGHYSRPEWNVVPVSSVIEIQFTMAPGTALVQKRHGGDGISVVIGGDAGTAEGDFASCMIWSSRPANELPVLMIVTNNNWGISTPASSQHAERHVIDRGKAFGIPGEVVDGNDPVASWFAVERAMRHVRQARKPYFLEAMVSRLHGHSSSSGAIRVANEVDCIEGLEQRLLQADVYDRGALQRIRREVYAEVDEAADRAVQEAKPTAEDVYKFTYAASEVDAVYPADYDGLPAIEKVER